MELQGLGRGAGSDKVRDSKKTSKKTPSEHEHGSGITQTEDMVSISNSAKVALKELQFVKAVKELPEVRQEKVEQAKEDLKSGKLLSPEIQEKTAEELLKIL